MDRHICLRLSVILLTVFFVSFACLSYASAAILLVPNQYPTIQMAIYNARNGDEVVVQPGTYYDNINFLGKAITVRSVDPSNPNTIVSTVINGRGSNTVCVFSSGEGSNSILAGLTLTNGMAYNGGGIACTNFSSPAILNCNITVNRAYSGGGIYCKGASPTIMNCIISGNIAQGDGGGAYLQNSSAVIDFTSIVENESTNGGGVLCHSSGVSITNSDILGNFAVQGAGIYCYYYITSNPPTQTIIGNCLIIGNIASFNGCAVLAENSSPVIVHCTIVNNTNQQADGAIFCLSASPYINSCIIGNGPNKEVLAQYGNPVVIYSNVEGGFQGQGNITSDPLFVDSDNNFHLNTNSPCIDTGDPNSTVYFDKEGISRPQDGNGDGVAISDMGAYEFADITPPVAVCKDATILLDSTGEVLLSPSQVDNGSHDNTIITEMHVNPNIFSCDNTGSNTVTLTVRDAFGNSDSCEAQVTVLDANAPEALCRDITVELDCTGNAHITAADIDNGSYDNCMIASATVSVDTFTVSDIGDNNVTLTLTDTNENTSTCSAVVTVEGQSTEPTDHFYGKVFNAATRQPISGARVTIIAGQNKTSVFTDADGAFAFKKVFPGMKTVTFAKRDFKILTYRNFFLFSGDSIKVNVGLAPQH